MFGWGELALILVLALILLGPDKLADIARTLGRIYGEYQKAKKRLELEIIYGYEIPTTEKIEEIIKKKTQEIRSDLRKCLNNKNETKIR